MRSFLTRAHPRAHRKSRSKTVLAATLTGALLTASPAQAILFGTAVDGPDWEAVVPLSLPGGDGCTATFIHPNFALTAAHCIERCTSPSDAGCVGGPPDGVINGDWRPNEGAISNYRANTTVAGIARSFQFDWVYFPIKEEHNNTRVPDVALLRSPVPFDGKIIPVLPAQDLPRPEKGNFCARYEKTWPIVAGFSTNNGVDTMLRRIGRTYTECDIEEDGVEFKLDAYGRSGDGVRICQGDSGGPVLWETGFGGLAIGGVHSVGDIRARNGAICAVDRKLRRSERLSGESGHAFVPARFLNRVARLEEAACGGAQSWETCRGNVLPYGGNTLRYLGTQTAGCDHPQMQITASRQPITLEERGTLALRLTSRTFDWTCGRDSKTATLPGNTRFVIARRGLNDGQVIFDAYEMRHPALADPVVHLPVTPFTTWATAEGVQPLTGDFNGDGRDDLALIRQTPGWGTIPTAMSNGRGGFSVINGSVGAFAGWATASRVRPLTGDFDGDGRTDIALLRQDPGWGTLPVAFATGNGGWRVENRASHTFNGWARQVGVTPFTGDFNGDGRTDIALLKHLPGWGTIPIAFADGNGGWRNTNQAAPGFANWAAQGYISPLIGDFDGDGRDDIALVKHAAGWGTMPVAFARGDGSWRIENPGGGAFPGWARQSSVTPLTGDFNGDGRDDLALVRTEPGWTTVPIALAEGSAGWRVTAQSTGDFSPRWSSPGMRPLVADFNGDGRSDIAMVGGTSAPTELPVLFANGDGTWRRAMMASGPVPVAAASPTGTRVSGDFDGDGRDDITVLDSRPGSERILTLFGR